MFNKLLVIVGLISVCMFPLGCTTNPRKAGIEKLDQFAAQVRIRGKTLPNSDDRDNLNRRVDLVSQMEKKMIDEFSQYELELNKTLGIAKDYGNTKVLLGWAGLASGITASALAVAAPAANAVWISGFSGFAGGVAGFSSVAENEGFSRALMLQHVITLNARIVGAITNFSTGELWLLTQASPFDPIKWSAEFQKQSGFVEQVRAARLELRTGPAPSPASSSALLESIQKNQKDILDKLDQAREGNSERGIPLVMPQQNRLISVTPQKGQRNVQNFQIKVVLEGAVPSSGNQISINMKIGTTAGANATFDPVKKEVSATFTLPGMTGEYDVTIELTESGKPPNTFIGGKRFLIE